MVVCSKQIFAKLFIAFHLVVNSIKDFVIHFVKHFIKDFIVYFVIHFIVYLIVYFTTNFIVNFMVVIFAHLIKEFLSSTKATFLLTNTLLYLYKVSCLLLI